MYYLMVLVLLFLAELFYFRVADRYNIIDKPNERSSHTKVTLRGGGIIFYFGGHYKIFCVNGNTGFRNESRIFYFIHLQNEEDYERKESSSAR